LTFSDGEPNRTAILFRTTGADGPTVGDIRKAVAPLHEAVCRVSDVTAGKPPFPVRVALTGEEDAKLRAWADAVTQRLARDEAATDAAVWPGPPVPHTQVEVDRAKAGKLGVNVADIRTILHDHLSISPDAGGTEEALKRLKIRAAGGEMVPLAAVVTFRVAVGPDALWSLNGKNALRLSANPPDGQTPTEAAARCVKIATEERVRFGLPAAYRAIDLTRPGVPR